MNMQYIYALACLLFLHIHLTEAKSRYNVSYAQLDTCEEFDIQYGGYEYRNFFTVHSLGNNKIADNERLHLKFYVITKKDAHILLSVTSRPREGDRVYEIVIGAGENSFSTIRTLMGRIRVATNQDAGLVSQYDPTPIEVVQTKTSQVLVYIPGYKEQPLLNYTDDSALNINYISFSSFGSTTARWFYDCEFDGFGHEIDAETRPISAEQRLIGNLAYNAQNKTLPAKLSAVTFAFQVCSVAFEQSGAMLRTRQNIIFYWEDEKLQWNPQDYAGITELVRTDLEIWTPEVIVINSAFNSLGALFDSAEIKIQANGSIAMLANNIELATWCVDAARNWPHEHVDCAINLGIKQFIYDNISEPLHLQYDDMRPLSTEPINTPSEWYFDQISVSKAAASKTARYTPEGLILTMAGDAIIEFTLKRNSTFYRNVFVMPIVACQAFIILSFLLRGYRRGALLLVVFILTTMGLMFISKHATPHYVPNLMLVYQHVMRIMTFCYFLHIVIMWLEHYPPKADPASFIVKLVNFSPLRLLLCMRFADSDEYVTIQEHPWPELAKIFNNIAFIITNLIFIALNVCLLPATD